MEGMVRAFLQQLALDGGSFGSRNFTVFPHQFDSHRVSPEFLRGDAGSAGAAERIKNGISFVGEKFDEPRWHPSGVHPPSRRRFPEAAPLSPATSGYRLPTLRVELPYYPAERASSFIFGGVRKKSGKIRTWRIAMQLALLLW